MVPRLELIAARDLHATADETVCSQSLNHSRKLLLQITQEFLVTYGQRRKQLLNAHSSSNLCIARTSTKCTMDPEGSACNSCNS